MCVFFLYDTEILVWFLSLFMTHVVFDFVISQLWCQNAAHVFPILPARGVGKKEGWSDHCRRFLPLVPGGLEGMTATLRRLNHSHTATCPRVISRDDLDIGKKSWSTF